jgi:homoserine acetyltransferase
MFGLPLLWATVARSVAVLLTISTSHAVGKTNSALAPPRFALQWEGAMVTSLQNAADQFHTEHVRAGARIGDVEFRYRRVGGKSPAARWQSASTRNLEPISKTAEPAPTGNEVRSATYEIRGADKASFRVTVKFASPAPPVDSQRAQLDWTVEIENLSGDAIEIGDLALPLPMNSNFAPESGKKSAVLKHSFISGDGSFLFWMRPDSIGPYLMLTPLAGTQLEYWEPGSRGDGGRDYRVFIHSAATGEEAKLAGRKWRQSHTGLTLAPAGEPGDSRTYGLRWQWADDYDAVRQTLVDEGLVDVHVAPGMTVPNDLECDIALRSRVPIHAVEAEFPDETTITPLAPNGEYQRYRVRLGRLGENRLTVRFGDNRHMHLEFFSTEPIETLIKKRAAFLTRSQHRDPSKWYNGLITDWNMESQVLPSPDNYDRISGFRIYALTCDDPGLGKPAYLAAKNAEFPVQSEVEALDYYVKHFVWGGLQQTTDEKHPYAIYGIPDWHRNRTSDEPGRDGQRHLWRVYDYPHIVLLYHSLYRVAKNFPHVKTELKAEEYLERAYSTAWAMFTVPMEIEKWSGYWTGFYNELVILDLINDLEQAGRQDQADTLRGHWEKKVKNFAGGEADLFQSEYAFDSTGFESTHALAKYALAHADDTNVDGGRKLDISQEQARKFMDKQIAANLFCRGAIEPAYYYLGSDYRGGAGNAYTLSYMSQMGGWSILDYALHYAPDANDYLRLGYASILSSWALMNSGTPESNFGYWYPGPENDGAAGGGFEPAPFGQTWLGQPHSRGSWYYSCEIDLGFSGALRGAATILTDDPIFGRVALGGRWQERDGTIEITPKDGVRRRFHALTNGSKLHVVLDHDRFAAEMPLRWKPDQTQLEFTLESDNPDAHTTTLELAASPPGKYTVLCGNERVGEVELQTITPTQVALPIPAGGKSPTVTISAAPHPIPAAQAPAALPPVTEGDYSIRDFKFKTGETLPELRMHYRTLGKPHRNVRGEIDNAVLILHGTTGSGAQFLRPEFANELFGPGQPLDAAKYYLILPDNIGHGDSSKPSDGLHAKFPRYGYLDMVEAQRRLLVDGLGVEHARLVIGTSMGGMHAWLWGQLHPEFMDALLPLASLPDQIAGRNRVWRRIIIDSIRNDPKWNGGDYVEQPPSLRSAAMTLYFMSSNPTLRLQEAPTLAAADEALDRYLAERLAEYDANDVAYALDASRDYDPAPGLANIKAPLLAINFADDLINPPELGVLERNINRVPRGRAIVIPASSETVGHGTHTKASIWKHLLIELLRETDAHKK